MNKDLIFWIKHRSLRTRKPWRSDIPHTIPQVSQMRRSLTFALEVNATMETFTVQYVSIKAEQAVCVGSSVKGEQCVRAIGIIV